MSGEGDPGALVQADQRGRRLLHLAEADGGHTGSLVLRGREPDITARIALADRGPRKFAILFAAVPPAHHHPFLFEEPAVASESTVTTCYRHPKVESHVRCTRCDRYICPDCSCRGGRRPPVRGVREGGRAVDTPGAHGVRRAGHHGSRADVRPDRAQRPRLPGRVGAPGDRGPVRDAGGRTSGTGRRALSVAVPVSSGTARRGRRRRAVGAAADRRLPASAAHPGDLRDPPHRDEHGVAVEHRPGGGGPAGPRPLSRALLLSALGGSVLVLLLAPGSPGRRVRRDLRSGRRVLRHGPAPRRRHEHRQPLHGGPAAVAPDLRRSHLLAGAPRRSAGGRGGDAGVRVRARGPRRGAVQAASCAGLRSCWCS